MTSCSLFPFWMHPQESRRLEWPVWPLFWHITSSLSILDFFMTLLGPGVCVDSPGFSIVSMDLSDLTWNSQQWLQGHCKVQTMVAGLHLCQDFDPWNNCSASHTADFKVFKIVCWRYLDIIPGTWWLPVTTVLYWGKRTLLTAVTMSRFQHK